MRYNRKVAIAILMVSVIVLLSTSFFITSTTISDTDPSTYVIVPILMLPLFLLFSLKNKPEPMVKKRDILLGTATFALFVLFVLALRLYFGFLFVSFRMDMLLFPLAIAALVSLLFGWKNLKKFKGPMLYSLLASPALLLPIIKTSNAFVQLNSEIVYNIINLFISGVKYAAPITISANGYNIGIGQTCVSLGIFIALAMFLIPLAYFYEGKRERKVVWVFSGVVLLFLLNIVRMTGISFVWLSYGPNATVALVHAFVGILLFYVVIVAMMFASKRYGLETKVFEKARKRGISRITKMNQMGIFIAFVFAFVYLYLTFNYSSSLNYSPLTLSNTIAFNYNNTQISGPITARVSKDSFKSFFVEGRNGSYAVYSLSNSTIGAKNPLVLIITGYNSGILGRIEQNSTLVGQFNFFTGRGTTDRIFDVVSDKTEFIVYNTELPFVFANDTSTIADAYLIFNSTMLPKNGSCTNYDTLYTDIGNLVNPVRYNQDLLQRFVVAECVSSRIIWS